MYALVSASEVSALLKPRVRLKPIFTISNLRNINSPDVVTAERRSHHARIVRPESE
jgi:hypothetical protein